MKKLWLRLSLLAAVFISVFSIKVFAATAHLEGEKTAAPSALDGIDASFLMANWYKFVLVAAGCLAGFIISNLHHYRKR